MEKIFTDMKTYTKEKSLGRDSFRAFHSRHTGAFVDWEILHRSHLSELEEMHLGDMLESISRDSLWYNTFLNNIVERVKKNNGGVI